MFYCSIYFFINTLIYTGIFSRALFLTQISPKLTLIYHPDKDRVSQSILERLLICSQIF
jgi:hypothetical protein